MNLITYPAHKLHKLLVNKEISCVELVQSFIEHINKVDSSVNAFITTNFDEALKKAREIDNKISQGETLKPLTGIPIVLKDNIVTKNIRTTCASRMLENFIPPYAATVAKKLENEGTVLLGKVNLDEFAMGSSTENSAFFSSKNPWDLNRVPGGSSGGSAAAVSAAEAVFALGSDTGGSIRQPAAFCGVVGLKPTYGRVSRYGLIAFASSFDQIGPLTKDVTDAALVLEAICGYDPCDSTSVSYDIPPFKNFLNQDIRGLRIGVPREYFVKEIESGVELEVKKALNILEDLGAHIEEMSLPSTKYALAAYYLIAPAEASSNLARYDGVNYGFRTNEATDVLEMMVETRSEGFGPEVKRRIMLGTYALSSGYYDAYYRKASQIRTLIAEEFEEAFKQYDILVTPTTPGVAFKLGEKIGDPLAMYLNDVCVLPVNMAGLPAISIPCGFSSGLPVGLQIIGKPFDEANILKVAYAYEKTKDCSYEIGREVQ